MMTNVFKKFDHRLLQIEPRILSLLSEIDTVRGEFKASIRLTPQLITSLRRSTLITSAGASTRIEGSKLSDEDVEGMMRSLSVTKFADRDSQEVQGYLEILQNVFDGFLTLPLRESTVLFLHKELLKYSSKDESHKGNYKKQENAVGVVDSYGKMLKVVFETTPAYLAAKETQELIDWTRNALEQHTFHHLLVIANFIVEFLKIHPFIDGNGRLSRILTNLLLLKSGYQFTQYTSHESIIERRKEEYYLALRKSQSTFKTDQDTIAPWLNFFVSVVHEQAKKAMSHLEGEKLEDMLSAKQLVVWKYLLTVSDASPSEIVSATHISMPTVRQTLSRLQKIGRLRHVGHGRATRYIKLGI